jgi:SnoaL-like domain
MSVQLPKPIDVYVKLENSGDFAALDECFAANAVVRDEGRSYEGLASIKRWKAETKAKYEHTVAPLAIAQSEGKTVLTARLTGNFPGSPVTLKFSFVLEDGKIESLEISP